MNESKSGNASLNRLSTNAKLNSEPAFQQVIDSVRNYITGYNQDGLPRFGILSIIAKRTPFFAYDHPNLMKLADTAFTDFHHCFFCNTFTKSLLLMDKKAKNESRIETNVLFVALHELSHIAKMHNYRMQQFSPMLANIAGDIRINMDLLKFLDVDISKELAENAWGCSQEEKDKWDRQSEEVIAYHLLSDANKKQKDDNATGNENGQNGQSMPGSSDPRTPAQKIKDLVDSLKNGGTLNISESKGDPNPDENHMVDLKDVIKACEEAGLENVLEKLQLPSSTDKAALDNMESKITNNLTNDSAELDMIRNESFNGHRMPGEHINTAVSELITQLGKPKITWRTALKEITQGDGQEYMFTDDVQHDLCYVAPADMGIADELYLGVEIPHERQQGTLINIMDTSGSVTYEELGDYCTEIFGQMDSMNEENGASEVIFMSADTAQRGEIITLTKENYEEFIHEIKIFGRGGTSFEGPLNSAFEWAEQNDKKIDGIIYWTDLGAPPPQREALPESIPPIIFMTHAEHYSDNFRDAVDDFAGVYAIDEELLLDFEQLSEAIDDAVYEYQPSPF